MLFTNHSGWGCEEASRKYPPAPGVTSGLGGGVAPVVAEPLEGNLFVAVYPPFSVWSSKEIEAAKATFNRARLLRDQPFGLYVHVPFCVHRCQYCYYRSYAGQTERTIDEYVDAVLIELLSWTDRHWLAGLAADFVYVGGGTPTLLDPKALQRLLSGIDRRMPRASTAEVTVECAPRSTTRMRLRVLRDAGVTRLSLGVQELDDAVLKCNDRVHRVADALRALAEIRRAGFANVNVDLIAGLPGQTDRTFERSLDRLLESQPDSVTIYPLEIPRNTPLACRLRDETLVTQPASWEEKRGRIRRAFERLEACGYQMRSAYAAVRDPRRHGFQYQDLQYRGADFLGIGVSAFSYLGGIHCQNEASLDRWSQAVGKGRLPLKRAHVLSPEERLVRELVLQLKLGRADLSLLEERHGVDVRNRFAEPLAALSARGLLVVDCGSITLTRDGLLHADRLIQELYLPQHRGQEYW